MIDDPIIEEVRKHRQEHAARFNYDLAAIFADLIEREKNSFRPVICRPPRRVPVDPIERNQFERNMF